MRDWKQPSFPLTVWLLGVYSRAWSPPAFRSAAPDRQQGAPPTDWDSRPSVGRGLSVAHLSRPRTSLPGKPSFPLGKPGTPLSEARLSYPECVRHRGSGDSGKGREGPAVQDELGSAPRRGSSWPGCLPRTHSLCCFIGCRPICMNLDSLWEALYTSSGGGVRSPSALGEGQGGRSNLAQLG